MSCTFPSLCAIQLGHGLQVQRETLTPEKVIDEAACRARVCAGWRNITLDVWRTQSQAESQMQLIHYYLEME